MTPSSDLPWPVERVRGRAGELHHLEVPFDRRLVRVSDVTAAAIVLGSAQSVDVIDAAAAERHGIEVATRHSGGGVVLLQPAAQIWIDVVVPRDDPLWDDDITRSSSWLGEAWRRTIDHAAEVHRGGVSDKALGRVACFAALGPGELSVDGRKVVGISQRRTRAGARFQCVAPLVWDPYTLIAVLAEALRTPALIEALNDRAGALPSSRATDLERTQWSVVEEFVSQLPPIA